MKRLACSVALAVVLVGCEEATTPPAPGPNVLSLELGGEHRSLTRALHVLQPETPEPTEPIRQLSGTPPTEPTEDPEPEPRGDLREVALGESQTIQDVSMEHLGTTKRWMEILELNGWTEEEARKLRVGTMVKLPAR